MKKHTDRLLALDGIRGIAITFVIFTHLNANYSGFIEKLLPPILVRYIFGSGITGVSILFILSGFFMMYMYPNVPDTKQFLQKRYTRIFPLFLTMTSVMMIQYLYPKTPWYISILLICFTALIAHGIWVYGVKKFLSTPLTQKIFQLFFILQVLTFGIYVIWVSRLTPIEFNQMSHPYIRNTLIYLVNATLTIPFGSYIPLLDGVYWSLAAEILFYIAYPTICMPIIKFGQSHWSKKFTLFTIFALMCLFASFTKTSERIGQIRMLQVPLLFYFIPGMILGDIYARQTWMINQLHRIFESKISNASIIIFFVILFGKLSVLNAVPEIANAWIHLLWAIPTTFAIAFALSLKSSVSKLFSLKPFTYLGTISYSLYLSHVPIINMFRQIYEPTSLHSFFLYIGVILFCLIFAATILHYLLERPYFSHRKTDLKTQQNHPMQSKATFALSIIAISLLVYICMVLIVYQSQFNFFSTEKIFNRDIVRIPTISTSQSFISMKEHPTVKFQMRATDDNFSVVTMHLIHKVDQVGRSSAQSLRFAIKEHGATTWISQSWFDPGMIGNSNEHPFGFIKQPHSKNKIYDIELSLSEPQSAQYILIDIGSYPIKGIYAVSKTTILQNPLALIRFMIDKGKHALLNQQAQHALILTLPLCIVWVYSKKRII